MAIAGGTFTITSDKDGIHAENTEDLSLGTLYIADGSFTIQAQGDAVSAQGALQIDGGMFDLYTGAGSASVEMAGGEDWGPIDGGRQGSDTTAQPQTAAAETEENSASQKGIKGENTFTINGRDICH